ncbi:hypothetical protein K456DRAFT_884196 [Colletotrichum gloeosporioides 23]|nr:hypothetical protein K456DRAFT_884196 [Colletotrichum gloeosporioides 23]
MLQRRILPLNLGHVTVRKRAKKRSSVFAIRDYKPHLSLSRGPHHDCPLTSVLSRPCWRNVMLAWLLNPVALLFWENNVGLQTSPSRCRS